MDRSNGHEQPTPRSMSQPASDLSGIRHDVTCRPDERNNVLASFRYKTFGYAALSAGARLQPSSFERRALRPNDVAMEILHAGVCHSDLHQARNHWAGPPIRSCPAMRSSGVSSRSAPGSSTGSGCAGRRHLGPSALHPRAGAFAAGLCLLSRTFFNRWIDARQHLVEVAAQGIVAAARQGIQTV